MHMGAKDHEELVGYPKRYRFEHKATTNILPVPLALGVLVEVLTKKLAVVSKHVDASSPVHQQLGMALF